MNCAVGEIWHHNSFYLERETGEWKGKYFLVLAADPTTVVYRLLTSRRNGRPYFPVCSHEDPYPGFFINIPGSQLHRETWIDLRECEDFSAQEFARKVQARLVTRIDQAPQAWLCDALLCCATAQDTTRAQRGRIYQSRADLGC